MASSSKIEFFRKWVLVTGVLNIVVYSALLFPFTLKVFLDISNAMSNALSLGGMSFPVPLNTNHLVMIHIVAILVVCLGIMLVIASFDIKNRAWFVFWEGLLRIIVFLYILFFVVCMNSATLLLLFGTTDLIIGAVYVYFIFTIEGLSVK
jgi:hypothetical protein